MSVSTHPVRESAALPDGARSARTVAREHAAEADRRYRLDPAAAEALTAAGFARHFVPARWGGSAGGVADAARALSIVGEGCMSAAWTGGVMLALGRMCANLPEEGQQEIWGDGPDVHLAGSVLPAGRVEAVPGGWRLSGEWPYASGVDFARWTSVGGLDHSPGEPVFRHFVLPRGDYTVRETWRNVGLRGTGSNSVVVADAFVPRHRSFTHAAVLNGSGSAGDPPCHRIPYKLFNGILFVAPGVGAIREALHEWARWTAGRREANRSRTVDRPSVRFAVSTAGTEVDTATMLVARAAAAADLAEVTPELPVRSTRDFAAAADLLVAAADRLFRVSGTHGQAESNPIQRVWRDVHCMAGHSALQPDQSADGWANHVLGGGSIA
ncbi:acyl-CoA dehydrogenase family protein [Nucisporomicrobium flavum]|uniref:acyl-CoA dehydrogenase family protein n=1 Tax=Nucisporomicrobium flavum TaxID=2785915 RepID=UPI003C2F02DD